MERLFDLFFSILRFLLNISAWVAQQLLPFPVDIFNSSDGEDVSGELEAILATVEPQKSIRFIWSSSHTEYFWLF